MPERENEKLRYLATAAIPAVIYFIFYNIGSYYFFHKTEVLASLFGAVIFFLMYFFLQVLGNRNKRKTVKK